MFGPVENQKRTAATDSFLLVSYMPLAKKTGTSRFAPGRVQYAPRCAVGIRTDRGRRNFDSAGRYDDGVRSRRSRGGARAHNAPAD